MKMKSVPLSILLLTCWLEGGECRSSVWDVILGITDWSIFPRQNNLLDNSGSSGRTGDFTPDSKEFTTTTTTTFETETTFTKTSTTTTTTTTKPLIRSSSSQKRKIRINL